MSASEDARLVAADGEWAFDTAERLASLTRDEVDALPYGFLVLDREGRVVVYNRYEARLSRLAPERVVGRDWFAQIAPCTRVAAFEGRFRDLFDAPPGPVPAVRFGFRFRFAHGTQDVLVQMARSPDGDEVFLTVARRDAPERAAPATLAPLVADGASGECVGPQGLALALPAGALFEALDALPDAALAALGRASGAALASSIERHQTTAGAPSPRETPTVEAMALLDEAFADAGWGRLGGDLSERHRGALEFVVRPPGWGGGRSLARVYEHALVELARVVDGRSGLEALWLDEADPTIVPWRFVIDRADAIAARRAEPRRAP